MNKKLLAIAIAGVLAAPLAQAQTANVTLYGRINIDAEVIINAKSGSPTGTLGIPSLGARRAQVIAACRANPRREPSRTCIG